MCTPVYTFKIETIIVTPPKFPDVFLQSILALGYLWYAIYHYKFNCLSKNYI